MSMTSEMSRIAAEFEAAQGARLAAVDKIGSGMQQDSQRNRASLKHTMIAHRSATKNGLRDIFGTVAFTRGAAEELIERFRTEREEAASALRDRLGSFAAELRETVGEELAHLTARRAKLARRAESTRRTQMKDLRRRVEALLSSADKLIENIAQDRQRAARIWEKHLHSATRQRRATARTAAADVASPRKRAARKTAKKIKHART